MNRRLSSTALVAVALGVGASPLGAHPGAGILVGPDGTVYFTLFGDYPAMMIRPGEEPVFVTSDMEPRFLHHLAWLPDGRLLTSPRVLHLAILRAQQRRRAAPVLGDPRHPFGRAEPGLACGLGRA